MTSPEKPIDIFYKRYVELHVIKQNGLPNYLDIQRKDMTFVKKNRVLVDVTPWAIHSSDMSKNFYSTVYDVTT
jgi:hypothetical protein